MRNRRVAMPPVPLRVGLVASPGTEGHSDFVGQLTGSQFAFDIVLAAASVQGRQAPSSIAGALVALARRGCDIAVVVRGGGSKADLAAFDTEPVARAMAMMPIPVWVGIGHTGDQSVADIVANRSFVTPTECGQELVSQVSLWWESVTDRAGLVSRRAIQVLDDASERDGATRHRLVRCALQQLQRHHERVDACADRLARIVPRQVEACASHLSSRAGAYRVPRGCRPRPPSRPSGSVEAFARCLRSGTPARTRVHAHLGQCRATPQVGTRADAGRRGVHSLCRRIGPIGSAGRGAARRRCRTHWRDLVTDDQAKDQHEDPNEDQDEIAVSELSYAEASRELDEIVEFFEHRDVDVDQLVARLQRATALVDELDRRVRRTRSQVEQLVPRLQASARPAGDDADSERSSSDELDQDEDELVVLDVDGESGDGGLFS